MSAACVADRLLDGQQALDTARWDEARAASKDALAARETADGGTAPRARVHGELTAARALAA